MHPHPPQQQHLTQELTSVISGFEVGVFEQNIIAYLFKKHTQLRDHVFFEDTDAWWEGEQPGFHTHFKFDYSLSIIHGKESRLIGLPLLVHYAGSVHGVKWGQMVFGKCIDMYMHNTAQPPTMPTPSPTSSPGCQFCGLALNEEWAVECMTHFILMHDVARNQSAKMLGLELAPLRRTEYDDGDNQCRGKCGHSD